MVVPSLGAAAAAWDLVLLPPPSKSADLLWPQRRWRPVGEMCPSACGTNLPKQRSTWRSGAVCAWNLGSVKKVGRKEGDGSLARKRVPEQASTACKAGPSPASVRTPARSRGVPRARASERASLRLGARPGALLPVATALQRASLRLPFTKDGGWDQLCTTTA